MSERRSYISSIFQNKCPRCREGNLFITNNAYDLKNGNNVKMYEQCTVCNQDTEIEVGFYYGTSYVSYALTVAFSGASFVIWYLLVGVGLNDNRLFWWLGINAIVLLLMQPLFMRLSRSIWISWFVKYDENWKDSAPKKSERIVAEHMNNW